MAKRYELFDNAGTLLGEVSLAKGVTMPQVNRLLVGGRQPLQLRDLDAEKATEKQADKSSEKKPEKGDAKNPAQGDGGGAAK